jgi:hypothetical protein
MTPKKFAVCAAVPFALSVNVRLYSLAGSGELTATTISDIVAGTFVAPGAGYTNCDVTFGLHVGPGVGFTLGLLPLQATNAITISTPIAKSVRFSMQPS